MKKVIPFLLTCGVLNAYGKPYPSVNLSTQASSQNPVIADYLLPLLYSSKNYLFGNFNVAYSPRKYNRSLEGGAVYRQAMNETRGWGSYAYFSYNRSLLKQEFLTFNPGLEYIGENLHLSWNGYFPLNGTRRGVGNYVWADQIGVYDYLRFTQHQQLNQMVQLTSTTGAGTDLVGSYRFAILDNARFTAGVYCFNLPSNPVGAIAVLESATYRGVSVNAGYSYDPLTNNTFTVGVKLHFDGKHDNQDSLHWVNQPIQHNLVQLTQANTIPISSNYRSQGLELVQKDNIWFFDPAAFLYEPSFGLQNCTYEHPCSNLSSYTTHQISLIAPAQGFQDAPLLYLSPGIYPTTSLVLFANESLQGRSNGYIMPAIGINRPQIATNELIIDGLNGNHSNTVSGVTLLNSGDHFFAVLIANTDNVYLDNLQIGINDTVHPWLNFASGILVLDSQNISLTNSNITLNNYFTTSTTDIIGIEAARVQKLSIENTFINTLAINAPVNSIGVFIRDFSNALIKNSYFNQKGTGTAVNVANVVTLPGITANLWVNSSTFTSNAKGNNGSAGNLLISGNSRGFINDSSFFADTTSIGSNNSTSGFQLEDNSHLIITNSRIINLAESSSGEASSTNFFLYDNSHLDLVKSNLYASGKSALVTGSTNLTLENNATATVYGGTLETFMAGGPSTGEPSGAVSIWAIDQSQISINDTNIISRSGNIFTGAVVLQAQNNAIMNTSNSTMFSYNSFGNSTPAAVAAIVSANNSQINISNSFLQLNLNGYLAYRPSLISSSGNSKISISDSYLQVFNFSNTPNIITYAAEAADFSIVFLNHNVIYLFGKQTGISEIFGNGQVIVN